MGLIVSDGQIKLWLSIEPFRHIVSKIGSLLEASVTVTSPGEVPRLQLN